MTVKRRPDLTLADLADMPPEWLVPFCEGSPKMWDELRTHRINQDREGAAENE